MSMMLFSEPQDNPPAPPNLLQQEQIGDLKYQSGFYKMCPDPHTSPCSPTLRKQAEVVLSW